MESMKIAEEEKIQWEEFEKVEKEIEVKKTKDSIVAEEKGEEGKNEVNESKTEKELDIEEERQ